MTPRIILITGGNGGLGLAIARQFLEKSRVDIVCLGVRERREHAETLAAEFCGRVDLVPLDVVDAAAWKAGLAEVLAKHERLDVLVNNAGSHEDALLATMPFESWDRVLRTNLDSVFHGCQAVLPTMISQRFGRIVNISSLSALYSPAGQANYAAAKAGVIGLTQSLAKEVARIGITVNAVCPGYIDTGALSDMGDEEKRAAAMRVPMRRLGKPAEVAAAVHFLACSEAGYITGSALKIDGGIL
jgi:3-oxoacyl-[acyl-carrier protein] reductase